MNNYRMNMNNRRMPGCGCERQREAMPGRDCERQREAMPGYDCEKRENTMSGRDCEKRENSMPGRDCEVKERMQEINGGEWNKHKEFPIGMAYVPWQVWRNLYEPCAAFKNGTIFKELNLEFMGRRCN